jgi:predicted GIY-YIG superfamily endonuclease
MGKRKYTNEYLAAIAKGYDSLKEFREKEFLVYDAIRSRKLLDELCGHMKRSQRKDYTDEELIEVAKRYDDLTLFLEEQKSAYLAIHRRGKIDEMCGHMKRDVRERTIEELAAIAKGYDDLTKFRKEQKLVYSSIVRKGLIDKLCGHMKRNMRPDYTDEELRTIASGYNDLTQFKKEQRYAYFAIHRHGKFDELCSHMKRNMRKAYTEEDIRTVALKYNTRDEFRKNSGGAYLAAHRRGILDDVCSHMEEMRRPKEFYSKGYCHVIALGYKTRGEFRKNSEYAYSRAWNEGWLDDICGHMKAAGNNLSKRLVYVYTFPDGYAYVGLTDDAKRRKYEHLHKLSQRKVSPVFRHIKETGLSYEYKELTDWLDADTAAKVEDDYIKKYKDDGWKMLNRMRGGGLGDPGSRKRKDKVIQAIVRQYEYVEDFKEREPEIYEDLCESRQCSKFCSGLKRRKKPSGYWTLERSIAVMPECNMASEFRKTYRQAYKIVKKAGCLDGYYPKPVNANFKWTLEKCATAARYCETRAEFRKKYRRAYERLLKEGLLDELFEDKEIGRH